MTSVDLLVVGGGGSGGARAGGAAVQVVLFKQMHLQFHQLQQSALQLVPVVMDLLLSMERLVNLLTSNLQQMA